jgi:hypothetical protein
MTLNKTILRTVIIKNETLRLTVICIRIKKCDIQLNGNQHNSENVTLRHKDFMMNVIDAECHKNVVLLNVVAPRRHRSKRKGQKEIKWEDFKRHKKEIKMKEENWKRKRSGLLRI